MALCKHLLAMLSVQTSWSFGDRRHLEFVFGLRNGIIWI